jgi:peroxiredoxin
MKNFVKIMMLLLVTSFASVAVAKNLADEEVVVGKKIADFVLPNAKGAKVSLYEELKSGPVVVSFYRGGWCPFCNTQLAGYQARLEDIKVAGGQLIAVSPEVPSKTELTMVKNKLSFKVLSDADNKIAEQYGLVFTLPAEKADGMNKWLKETTGSDLAEFNGVEGNRLPIPATFVIGTDGVVTYLFKNPDYKQRADLDDVIAALKAAK